MLEQITGFFKWLLCIDCGILNTFHMVIRAIIIYALAIVLVRITEKRFLARPSPFDLVLAMILGSVISRAINSNAPLFPTIFASLALVLLHALFAHITFFSSKMGALIKGSALILIEDGEIQWDNMERVHITERDLLAALRRNAQVLNPADVRLAILERNGEISVIPKKQRPEILEIKVEKNIQTIRIKLEK